MGEGELAHQHWVHAQLDPALRPVVAARPWIREEDIGGAPVAFHFALDETGRGFADPAPDPDPTSMDRLFALRRARLVFYDHLHYPSSVTPDIVGRARYVNPGALGCSREPLARYALVDVDREGAYRLEFRAVSYEPSRLFDAFEEREVLDRAFIIATFLGGRDVALR